VVSLRRVATAALFGAGIALGGALAGVAFGYQGDHPVNVFTLLGVLVGVPLLLLAGTVILLPGRIPGLAGARDAFSGMNPARWAGALLDRFADTKLFALLGNPPANAFARWQLVVFSQWFAVGFFTGVLATAWLLVVFTDLAFGWSTTLEIQAAEISKAVSVLAKPWSAWLPAAVPDASLVETSRIYRLEEGGMPTSRVVRLGQWWPFVLMTITAYGLLPRLVLLGIGAWRLSVATRSMLREDPEVTALLDRLNTPRASFDAETEPEAGARADELPPPAPTPTGEATAVIVWNEAGSDTQVGDWFRRRFESEPGKPVGFSVLQSQAAQHRLLDEMGRNVRRLVIFTKGWEPPLLEFSDFLSLARDRLGREVSFTLVPLDVTRTVVEESEREVWGRALSRQRDPRLYVVEADAGQAAPP
jgi:hypothetical protein